VDDRARRVDIGGAFIQSNRSTRQLGDKVLLSSAVDDDWVMHVVPANGGGVDRYVRDICSLRPRDVIIHVSTEQIVVEQLSPSRFLPINIDDSPKSTTFDFLGTPSLIHAHSTLLETRNFVSKICSKKQNLPYVLTLHDIKFSDDICPLSERASRLAFVIGATAWIAPSEYIASLVRRSIGVVQPIHVISPGIGPRQNTTATRSTNAPIEEFSVAVVGALGHHKGLAFLQDLVTKLPSSIRVVLLGYAEDHLTPGWMIENKLWVHGPFQPEHTKALLDAYGCSLVLFPNRQPESYSYTLSDVWCAGLPVLVPDKGALGERVSLTAGGWLYDANASAETVASVTINCLDKKAEITQRQASVILAAEQLPSIASFVNSINQIYAKYMVAHTQLPNTEHLRGAVAPHLNAAFFREELSRMGGDLDFTVKQRDSLSTELQQLGEQHNIRGEWMEKLGRDLAELNSEIQTMRTALDASTRAHATDVEKLSRDVTETLSIAHRYERALSALPRVIRRWALRQADADSTQKK
jgi:hypothetical protein